MGSDVEERPAAPRTTPPDRLWEELARDGGRMMLLVLDGAGGLPHPERGGTALGVARTPHLDALAARGSCGLFEPVGPGITPGSGPGHLALFGYEPTAYRVGRGVLSALGTGFELEPGDVAARANFATLADDGTVVDRRAGRIPTEECERLCARVRDAVELDFDGRFFFEPVRGHRAVLVLRDADLSDAVADTDPQATGVPPRPAEATAPAGERTARLIGAFVEGVREALAGEERANGLLLRGVQRHEPLRGLKERFGLRARCVARYPMYRGVSRLLGMDVAPVAEDVEGTFETVAAGWDEGHDLVFVHAKHTDSRGEDGNFDGKVEVIERVDALLPRLLDLRPDALLVTSDHSTPAAMASHSWHPVPAALAARHARVDAVDRFDELACVGGALGLRPSLHAMGLLLAHAGRLRKFGA
jgi:2,3-bisphosphoglycerate-independent phosphoglycerate mutase